MKKFIWNIIKLISALILLAVTVILLTDNHVSSASRDRLYSDISETPEMMVAVVPGTSKYTIRGTRNRYYQNRLDAAYKLFEAGKISYIIVSGDNSEIYYDEPSTMKRDLMAMGIPGNVIYRDHAGFRTLDTVVRTKEIFQVDSFIFVSQRFQNQRAIYIARAFDIDAIGFNARDVSPRGGLRVQARERLARIAAILDVNILRTQPKFLGPAVPVGEVPGN